MLTPSYVRLGYFALAVIHGGIGATLSLQNVNNVPISSVLIRMAAACLLYMQVIRYIGLAITNKEEP